MNTKYPYHPEKFVPDIFDMIFLPNPEVDEGHVLEWSESQQSWWETSMSQYKRNQIRDELSGYQNDIKPIMFNVPSELISVFCWWIEERHIGRGFEGGRSRKLTYKQIMKYVYDFHSLIHMLAKFKYNPAVDGSIDTEQLYIDSDQD